MTAPISILISALGGEGGGVLASWITNAAAATGLKVQRTSVPGVAQRTGATTYYLEIHSGDQDAGLVLSLTPMPGAVDVVVATELLEAGRAIQSGFVTPERTTLIASTHRVFAIAERAASGEGRVDASQVKTAADALAHTRIMFDMAATARDARSQTNAVILGALAASGRLPIDRAAFRSAIETSGVASEANLRGFGAGFNAAQTSGDPVEAAAEGQPPAALESLGAPGDLAAELPPCVAAIAAEAVRRLRGYQDPSYADLFLARLRPIAKLDGDDYALSASVARHLAATMAYEDALWVAQLKSSRQRIDRVRRETGSAPGDVVRIAEYLKPGPEEFAAILPPALAHRLLRWADRPARRARLTFAMKVRTTTVWGYLQLRLLASLRRWRRKTFGFQQQRNLIERWLTDVATAIPLGRTLALEVAECASIVKGYGATHRRGAAQLRRILDLVVGAAVADRMSPATAADALIQARHAAQADETGEAFDKTLASITAAIENVRRHDRAAE